MWEISFACEAMPTASGCEGMNAFGYKPLFYLPEQLIPGTPLVPSSCLDFCIIDFKMEAVLMIRVPCALTGEERKRQFHQEQGRWLSW